MTRRTLSAMLDDFGRRHPLGAVLVLLLLTVVVTLVLLNRDTSATIMYQDF